jgi:hypothetical protein
VVRSHPLSSVPSHRRSDGTYLNSHPEKENEKKARAAVKAQIEADRQERAQKAAQEKAIRDGATAAPALTGPSAPAAAAPATTTTTTTTSIPGREFKETRLQIRLASGGQPLTTTLPSDSSCVPLLLSFPPPRSSTEF